MNETHSTGGLGAEGEDPIDHLLAARYRAGYASAEERKHVEDCLKTHAEWRQFFDECDAFELQMFRDEHGEAAPLDAVFAAHRSKIRLALFREVASENTNARTSLLADTVEGSVQSHLPGGPPVDHAILMRAFLYKPGEPDDGFFAIALDNCLRYSAWRDALTQLELNDDASRMSYAWSSGQSAARPSGGHRRLRGA